MRYTKMTHCALHHSEQLQYDAPDVVQYNGFIATVQPNQGTESIQCNSASECIPLLKIHTVYCGLEHSGVKAGEQAVDV